MQTTSLEGGEEGKSLAKVPEGGRVFPSEGSYTVQQVSEQRHDQERVVNHPASTLKCYVCMFNLKEKFFLFYRN